MSVKEAGFLSIYMYIPPALVLFMFCIWQQFVCSQVQCFPGIVSQAVSLLFMWVFHTASREEMFENGEMQFLFHKKTLRTSEGEVKSGASVVTVAAFDLLKLHF